VKRTSQGASTRPSRGKGRQKKEAGLHFLFEKEKRIISLFVKNFFDNNPKIIMKLK
jgi:hypothetical protein